MRVLFWSECFLPSIGGAEVLAAHLLPALQRRGYEFIVVTGRDTQDLDRFSQYRDIPVRRFPFRPALEGRKLDLLMQIRQQLSSLMQAFEPDLVHVNLLGPSVMLLRQSASVCPAPLLVTLHRTYRDLGRDTLIHSTLRSADWITTCSATVLGETRRQLAEIRSNSSVILNSLEAPAIVARRVPLSPPRLLCVGRVLPEKGFDLALAALAALVDRFPTARLTIVGDGPDRASLQLQATERGIAHAVDFVGWVDPVEVPALIDASTLVVMPSRYESFGLVALQAAQQGRPVVATRLDGLQEVIEHGKTGLLVEKEDSAALAEAIANLLNDPDRARRMGEAARRRALKVFSWDRFVDAYDALYRRLIAQKPAARVRQSRLHSVSE